MKSTEATVFDRKSGAAEGPAVRPGSCTKVSVPYRFSPSHQLQLIPHLHLAITDLARRQFQHAMYLQVDAGHPERTQPMPNPEHPKILAQRHHIDRKQHAKRMNSG